MDEIQEKKRKRLVEKEINSSDEDSLSPSLEEEEELAINLDQHGRIIFGGSLNYDFQCYENIFDERMDDASYATLSNDCDIAFTAREMEDDDDYSSGDTFFLYASEDKPRTKLEQLVKRIFRHHTKGINYDPTISGAEWWTLVVDPDDGGVGFHWDKDYNLEHHGVSIFPHMATVTYISNLPKAAPTIIMEKTAPPMYADSIEGKAGENVYISWPKQGRHITFDGRFLHAACTELIPSLSSTSSNNNKKGLLLHDTKRISLLVNVWLNHVPKDASKLPKHIVNKLSPFLFDDDTTIGNMHSNNNNNNNNNNKQKKLKRHIDFVDVNFHNNMKQPNDIVVKKKDMESLKMFKWELFVNSIEYVVRAYIPIKAIEAFKGNHLDGNLCRLIYDMTEEEAFLPNIQVKKI